MNSWNKTFINYIKNLHANYSVLSLYHHFNRHTNEKLLKACDIYKMHPKNAFDLTSLTVELDIGPRWLNVMTKKTIKVLPYEMSLWYQVWSLEAGWITPVVWREVGQVVKTPAFGSESPRFDPRLQVLEYLSLQSNTRLNEYYFNPMHQALWAYSIYTDIVIWTYYLSQYAFSSVCFLCIMAMLSCKLIREFLRKYLHSLIS